MNEEIRVPLDAAIDRVATKLVSVEPDELMSDRITARLPERSSWTWIGSLTPHVAAAVGVAIFALFLFSNRSTTVVDLPATKVATVQPPIVAAPAPHKGAPYDPTVIAKAPTITQLDNAFDRDHGLTPVARPEAIVIAPIVLDELPLVTDLPLTREY